MQLVNKLKRENGKQSEHYKLCRTSLSFLKMTTVSPHKSLDKDRHIVDFHRERKSHRQTINWLTFVLRLQINFLLYPARVERAMLNRPSLGVRYLASCYPHARASTHGVHHIGHFIHSCTCFCVLK